MTNDKLHAVIGFLLGCTAIGLGFDTDSATLCSTGFGTAVAAPCLALGPGALRPVLGFILGSLVLGLGLESDYFTLIMAGLGLMVAMPILYAPPSGPEEPPPA